MIEGLFYVFGAIAIVSALGMLFNLRNTVASALCLVMTMVSLAAVYVLLEAHFVAVLQILVYAGAILVLFLFVVMLLNLRRDVFPPPRARLAKGLGILLVALVLLQFLGLTGGSAGFAASLPEPAALPAGYGGYRQVGMALFTDYVLAFEVCSLLLLSAMVGAIVLAKRRID